MEESTSRADLQHRVWALRASIERYLQLQQDQIASIRVAPPRHGYTLRQQKLNSEALPMAVLLIAILGAALVGWVWLYFSNSSIALTASHLVITDWRDSPTVIARSDVSRLIRVGVRPFEGPPRQAVIGVDAENRSLFTLGGAYHAAAIAGSLSVPLSGSYDDVLTLGEINRRFPGATRGAVSNPQRIFVFSIVATGSSA